MGAVDRDSVLDGVLLNVLRDIDPAPVTAARVSQTATAVRWAAHGLGAALVPASVVPHDHRHLVRPVFPAVSQPVIAVLRQGARARRSRPCSPSWARNSGPTPFPSRQFPVAVADADRTADAAGTTVPRGCHRGEVARDARAPAPHTSKGPTASGGALRLRAR
ncbi:hypothetical protein GCM10010279_39720 [Streptomyces mutabilis]|nr:hypothetical protein GCM10010279_39720 [Streptomyces mutabilis]